MALHISWQGNIGCRPAPPGRSATQARPIPERLNRCRAAREAPGGEPPPRALGFEAVWVDVRLPEALRFLGMRPPAQHRRRENNSQCDATQSTARVKADRAYVSSIRLRSTRHRDPRNPPSTLWIKLGVPFTGHTSPGSTFRSRPAGPNDPRQPPRPFDQARVNSPRLKARACDCG